MKLLPASSRSGRRRPRASAPRALAAAALDHPCICKVHEIGDADGRVFIVMEYVEGETLHVASRRALLPMRQVIDLELAQALEVAHRH